MMDNGSLTKCMGRELSHGLMGESTQENMWMTKNRVMEYLNGIKMKDNILNE